MIRRFLRALGSAIGITVIVALVLSLCLWFLGPFVGIGGAQPFESVLGRLVGLAVMWIVVLVIILLLLLRGAKRDDKLADDIVSAVDEGPVADEMVTAELSEMRGKLRTAMAKLRRSKRGRRHLYELPWYIIIGPPGAGKTTAIVNSGLQFPLADELGKGSIGGVGGTRNCDWWFTDNAVLVDTAGRYTTQESDAEADNAAWLGFLNLLKKHRKRQPINGALVAISLSDLSMQDELTQKAHAAAVRRRLSELREKLGVRFPVYVVFTKADLIAGFTEFFEDLGKEEREQVWGFTLPLTKGRDEHSPVGGFDEEFGLLLARLNDQSLEKLQAEADTQRRSLIAGFPAQLASVRQVARDFLAEVFQENSYEHRQLLRGVYFTSGTQEGTPIDRLMMGMARTFGIGRQAIGTGRGSGRSYFLTRLFEGVIFREAGLVSADDRAERRYRWSLRGAVAAVVIASVGMGALWARSYIGNRALAAEAAEQIDAYQKAAAQLPGGPIADTDLARVAPALDILRDMPTNPLGAGAKGMPPGLGWGLYQGDQIGNSALQTYRAALNQQLLPRLLLNLEDQMQSNVNDPQLLYDALKVYLMLGLVGPMDKGMVEDWMARDWEQGFPGAANEQLRADLAGHLDAMLSQPMQKIALNNDLVTKVQGILNQMPLAQRVYNGIINGPAATALPEFRLTDVGGPAIAQVFVRSSGKPLNDGIEGIFTNTGFHNVFLTQALSVAAQIQRDSWVLGPAAEQKQSQQALIKLSRDVLGLYYNDYISRYDQLLGDIDIVPMNSLSQAVEVTNVLSGPTSPIVNVLNAVEKETRLVDQGDETVKGAAKSAAGQTAELQIANKLSLQSRIFLDAITQASAAENGGKPMPPGEYVQSRFDWLHQLVNRPEGQPSQLDTMMQTLTDVYRQLAKLSFAGGISNPNADNSALASFLEQAGRIQGPMQRWAKQIAAGSSGITADSTRAGIDAEWKSSVLPLCQQATTNHYPFNRRAGADISIKDFAALFAPGGLIDSFFTKNLAKYVDTSQRTWVWKTVNGTDLGISAGVLAQMQRASEIRDAFFAGGQTPAVSFQITPEALDPKARRVQLTIGDQTLEFAQNQGQPPPVAFNWPTAVGTAQVVFIPQLSTSENGMRRDGPWAFFRLLDAAEIRRTNVSDRSRIIFNIGGRIAIFQMQAGSVLNPFSLPALSKFSCPKSF